MRDLVIESRFNGPRDSGHGGYASGLLAQVLGGVVETTLRRPVPLGRPLDVVDRGDRGIAALDDEEVVIEAQPTTLDLEVPEAVSVEEAEAKSTATQRLAPPPEFFSKCFVCGAERPDGLGVVARPVVDRNMVASPWTPPTWVADEDAAVRPEFLWAVLDCPAYFGAQLGGAHPLSVLGRFTVDLGPPLRAGTQSVVAAWPIATQGRKHDVGAAIFGADGELHARALSLFIEPRAGNGPPT